jgi:hypothetical protein
VDSKDRQELHGLVTAMPEELVREVLAFARETLAKAKIDVSYEWSEEDIKDFKRSGDLYLEKVMPWEDEASYDNEEQRP